jgi:hypothetical protein
VFLFFGGELQEDVLALGVIESFAVFVICDLFGIWNLRFRISAGLPAVIWDFRPEAGDFRRPSTAGH